MAIQQNGPKAIGFFGTRNMGFMHQQLIEILSYAMVLTVRPPATPPVHWRVALCSLSRCTTGAAASPCHETAQRQP
jgi:hypothetical protein